MRWIRFDADCIESDDSRYSIDRARVCGKERFTAWFRGARPSENLGCCNTPELAKSLCLDHARRTTELEFIPAEATR